MARAKILQLPSKLSPKEIARAYMLGELSPQSYAKKFGGIYRLMKIADHEKALGAAEKALKQLRDLSRIDFEQDKQADMDVRLDGWEDILKENTA